MGAWISGRALRRLAIACALIGTAGFATTAAAAAAAATYTVGTSSDTTTGSTCPNFPSGCSLRQLIEHENGLSSTPDPPDVIFVPAAAGGYGLTNGPLMIDQTVAIVGAGARGTGIYQDTASPTSRVFDIQQNAGLGVVPTVVLSGLGIHGGKADNTNGSYGGDIRNQATLDLTSDLITGGNAQSGAGISNDGGTLIVTSSLVSGNNATSGGADSGGIQNYGDDSVGAAQLIVEDSTIADKGA